MREKYLVQIRNRNNRLVTAYITDRETAIIKCTGFPKDLRDKGYTIICEKMNIL